MAPSWSNQAEELPQALQVLQSKVTYNALVTVMTMSIPTRGIAMQDIRTVIPIATQVARRINMTMGMTTEPRVMDTITVMGI
ncbi:hypothetical protein PBN151_4958 [Paenibacillus sp. NAIST15-1]|nr:hypothetical protein PBN151_4958 [Paenibacillus sp. NAIST15-1]